MTMELGAFCDYATAPENYTGPPVGSSMAVVGNSTRFLKGSAGVTRGVLLI
jgi:hypothetical protein